ncbi:MAG: regulatory iron-sulfur-containing complex subunit RicT [Phycisphaerae bacterium]
MSDATGSPSDAAAHAPDRFPANPEPKDAPQPPRRPTLLEAMLAGGLTLDSEDKLSTPTPPSQVPPQDAQPQSAKSFEEMVKEAALRAQAEAAARPQTVQDDVLPPAFDDSPAVSSAPEAQQDETLEDEDIFLDEPESASQEVEEPAPSRLRPMPAHVEAPAWQDVAEEPASAGPTPEQIKAQQQEAAWAQRAKLAQAAKPRTKVPAIIEGPMVVVRYGVMRGVGQFRHNLSSPPPCGARVVIRTSRGIEIGEVTGATVAEPPAAAPQKQDEPPAAPPKSAPAPAEPPEYAVAPGTLDGLCKQGCGGGEYRHRGCMKREELAAYVAFPGEEYAIAEEGRVLRVASAQDLVDASRITTLSRQESIFCRKQAQKMGLTMKIVGVDHVLGGDRIIFYFTSENRIDFRKLVQALSSEYHTRIEMRQVGARDEARLVADYEKCGQQCCCQSFLKELKPVSMRMAKTQKASLDPTKISGRCGRLMCCMRYEDDTYEDLRKLLPKRKTFVRTAEVFGKVLDGQILSQMVLLALPDGTQLAVPNESIIERNMKAPPEDLAPRPQLGRPPMRRPGPALSVRPSGAPAAAPRPVPPPRPAPAPAPVEAEQSAPPRIAQGAEAAAPGAVGGQGKKKRRRRRRKGKSGSDPQGNAPQGDAPPPQGDGQE